ncbi:MAG: NERD domain-containing protein [bacterium]
MGKMIPDKYIDTGSNAEKKIFETLNNTLPDDWNVIHSFKWIRLNPNRGRKMQGEGDFIILTPEYGVLVIEVKGGGISYESGNWYSENIYGETNEIQDPVKQAEDTKYEIIRRFNKHKIKCGVWHCVWFPDIDNISSNELPAHLNERIVLNINSLVNPFIDIKDAYLFWLEVSKFNTNRLSIAEYRKVLDVLSRRLKRVKLLKSISQDLHDTYVRLTEEQYEVLEGLKNFNKLSIKGRAGTGKTLLAVKKAKLDSQENKKVLLLCYNTELANYLKLNLEKYHNINVSTIHSYALNFMQENYQNRVLNFNEKPDFDYLMEEFIEVSDEKYQSYDSIIIDEGQDFKRDWIESVKSHLSKNGSFYIFYDPYQELYTIQDNIDDSYLVVGGPYELIRNMRNTDEITRSLYNILDNKYNNAFLSGIHGKKPQIKFFNNKESLKENLISSLNNLITNEFVNMEDITLLTMSNTVLPKTNRINKSDFNYTTVRKFKGLENDIIIVLDADLSHIVDPVKKRLLYVALSRAKVHTVIFMLNNPIYKNHVMTKLDCTENDIEEKLNKYINMEGYNG